MTALHVDGIDIDVVFGTDDVAKRVEGLAQEIANAGLSDMVVVSILKGSFMFAADLLRALHGCGVDPEVDFLTVSSYRTGTTSSGVVEVLRDITAQVNGRDVLIVDDILDTGRTLAFARDLLVARGAARVLTCVLLDKPVERAIEISADFTGFECPDAFVVGYGMDLANRFRQLPFVGRLAEGAAPSPGAGKR